MYTPSAGGKYGDKAAIITESRIIMDYLEATFTGEEYLALYAKDPIDKAW